MYITTNFCFDKNLISNVLLNEYLFAYTGENGLFRFTIGGLFIASRRKKGETKSASAY